MAKKLAMVIGVILVVVGALGFFMPSVFGVFDIGILLGIVDIVLGIWLIVGSRSGGAVAFKWVGIMYIVIAILGFIASLNFLGANIADDWLHLVVGIILAIAGFSGSRSSSPSMQPM